MYYTRESVFVGALRSFCSAFAVIIGIALAVLLIVIGASFFSSPVIMPEKSTVYVSADAEGRRELLPMSSPVILRIDFHGEIGIGDLTYQNIETLLLDSREDLFKDNRVKAILMHVNTPGGLATDSDFIYQAIKKYKEQYKVPVFAYVDDLCASGGMFITAAADRVYASTEAIVGSIGVVMGPAFNFSKTMDNWGVQSLTLTQGKDKDMLNPFRPWKEGEDASLRNIMSVNYERFVSVVTSNRPKIDKEKLFNEYGAQVYLSPQAQEIGYIDVANSDYNTTLRELANEAGIQEHERYQVFTLKPARSFFSELAQNKFSLLKGKITHVLQLGSQSNEHFNGKTLYLYQPNAP